MAINEKQAAILLERRADSLENRDLKLSRLDREHLRRWLKPEKPLAIKAIILLLLQGFVELFLIVVSHRYLSLPLSLQTAATRLSLLIVLLGAIYLTIYFQAIKNERTLVINIINNLRRRWFRLALSRKEREANWEEKSRLLAKVSYHLPLLASGLTNSLIGVIRFVMLVALALLLVLAYIPRLWWLLILSIFFSLFIGIAAFFISRKYVSRETTFYSRIIRFLDFSLTDWQFTRTFGRQGRLLADFDHLVDIDSYFRVRRDLWLRFGGGLIFVFLIVLAVAGDSLSSHFSAWLSWAGLKADFSLAIFAIYFSRLLYESLRAGLYSFPLFLGLKLSLPERGIPKNGRHPFTEKINLAFTSRKFRPFKGAKYLKDLNFSFQEGKRYLFVGRARSGKSALAKIFCGYGDYGRRAWVIKQNRRRYQYNSFFKIFAPFYYLGDDFNSQRSLLEVLSGKTKEEVSPSDVERLAAIIRDNPEFSGIFLENDDWRAKANRFLKNRKDVLAIQVLSCLYRQPRFVAIDNCWLDREDEEVNTWLKIMAVKMPNSVLVFFAAANNSVVPVDKVYEI
jgi:hypothetical protein